jgi:SpoVK/Ycf46/Vps4 family AAA+-type ATPase
MASVGGLNRVKTWARKRRKSFTKAARDFGLEDVRGILVVGPQGTGKSLVAEAIAAEWGTPLYEFNLSACKKSLVGQSGATLRSVFKRMKSTGRACLRMDEIDKAVPSASAGQHAGDSGVGQSMKGELLTWMNDHTEPVTVIGTANDIRNIDAALFRPGRVDTIFFVDLPTTVERAEIFKIHCEKEGRAHSIEIDEDGYQNAAEASVGFVGAEIEQAVKDAMIEAFDQGVKVNQDHLIEAVSAITPSGETFGDQLEYIRQFKSKVKPASDPEPAKANGGRKVRRGKRK